MATLLKGLNLEPLPDRGEGAANAALRLAPLPPEEPNLAEAYGRFDDLVTVDAQGRAHREGGKFLSNHELGLIAYHQDLIRGGVQALATEQERQDGRRAKLIALYGISNYNRRYQRRPRSTAVSEEAVSIPPAAPAALTPAKVALAAIESQQRAPYVQRPQYERVRTRRTVGEWWADIDSFDRGMALVGAVVLTAFGLWVGLDRSSNNDTVSNPPPGQAHSAPAKPHRPAEKPQTPPAAAKPTDIRLPAQLQLKAQPRGDSIWREVATSIRVAGHPLSELQKKEVTAQVMRDNHVRSEYQAEHLPVGFKARVTSTVRRLLQSFIPPRK